MGAGSVFDDAVAAARHGSSWGWGRILQDIGPPIQAYARSQGVPDPEDLLGQVLEGVVRGIERFDGDESMFRSWVFTIAHSRIIDDRRRRNRRPQEADAELPDLAGATMDVHDSSEALSREAAMEMLDGLPDGQRHVLALRVVAGLSVDETARVLGKRPGAIRVAMHKAVRKLEQKSFALEVTP